MDKLVESKLQEIINGTKTITAVADELKISRQSVYKWLSRYKRQNAGVAAIIRNRKSPSAHNKIPSQIETVVIGMAEKFPEDSVSTLASKLESQYKVVLNSATVFRILKRNNVRYSQGVVAKSVQVVIPPTFPETILPISADNEQSIVEESLDTEEVLLSAPEVAGESLSATTPRYSVRVPRTLISTQLYAKTISLLLVVSVGTVSLYGISRSQSQGKVLGAYKANPLSSSLFEGYSSVVTGGITDRQLSFVRGLILSPKTFSTKSLASNLVTVVKEAPRLAKVDLEPIQSFQSLALSGYKVSAAKDSVATVGSKSNLALFDRISLSVFCGVASFTGTINSDRCNYDKVAGLTDTETVATVLGFPVGKNEAATTTASTTLIASAPPTLITRYITQVLEGTPGRDGQDGTDGRDGKDGVTSLNNIQAPLGFGSYVIPSYSSPTTAIGISTISYLKDVTIESPTMTNGVSNNLSLITPSLKNAVFSGLSLFSDQATFTGNVNINNLTATSSTLTSATITNLLATAATTTDSYISRLVAASSTLTDAMLTNSTTTNAYITSLVAASSTLSDLIATNATTTNATTTRSYVQNFFADYATTTNAYITSLVAASSTLSDLIVTNATSTNLSVANLTVGTSTGGTLTLNGDLRVNGTSTLATTTVTDLMASRGTSTSFFSTLLSAVTGLFTDLTATNATTTNLFTMNGFIENASTMNISGAASIFTSGTTTNFFTQNLAVGNNLTSGNQTINGTLNVNGTTTIGSNTLLQGSVTLGTSTSNFITVNGLIDSDLVPASNITYDLGSPSFYWKDIYSDNITVNTITAGTSNIGGTDSEVFTINADNSTTDTESMSLVFFRGLVTPNALLRWNTTTKRLESNMSFKVQNETPVTGTTTFTVQGGAGQGNTNLVEIKNNGGTTLTVIDANGNVGIGSSTPGSALTVVGTSTLATTTISNGIVTNLSATNATSTHLGSSNLNATNATFTNATSTNFFATVFNAVTSAFTNFTATNATTTNLFASLFNAVTGTVNTLTGGSITATSSLVSNGTLNVTGQTTLTTASSSALTATTLYTTLVNATTGAFTNLSSTGTSTFATTGGNVGIGTMNPGAKLDVQTAGATSTFFQTGQDTTGNASVRRIVFQQVNFRNAIQGQVAAWTPGDLLLNPDGGNIGIGTITPGAKLHVDGGAFLLTNSGQAVATIRSTSSTGSAVFPQLNIENYSNDTGFPVVELMQSRGTSISPLSVVAGDILGGFNTWGNNGATRQSATRIQGLAETTFSSSVGAALQFFTTTGGSQSEKMRITGNGNVGIGTTTPGSKLDVWGNLTVGTSSTPALFVNTATGNVGIGVTGGIRTLEVAGSGRFFTAGQGDVTITHASLVSSITAAGSVQLALGAGGNEALRISTAGNVGIGTTTPQTQLHLSSATPFAGGILVESTSPTAGGIANIEVRGRRDDTNGSTPFGGSLYLSRLYGAGNVLPGANDTFSQLGNVLFGGNAGGTTTSNIVYPASIGGIVEGTFTSSTTANTGLVFRTGATGLAKDTVNAQFGTERMRITSTGNVGIGTTTPQARLTVQGTSTGRVSIGSWVDPTYGAITLNGAWGGVADYNFLSGVLDTNLYINRPSGKDILFGEQGIANQLVIKSGGNVGIGTTTPGSKLTVTGGNLEINGSVAPGVLLRPTSGSSYVVGANTGITGAGIYDNTGGVWRLMVQDTTGNVGIGTTTPIARLQVANDIDITNGNTYGQLWVGGSTNANKALNIGFDTTDNYGFIQSVNRGIDYMPLVLNQYGGNVGIGTSTPSAKLTVSPFQSNIGTLTNNATSFIVGNSTNLGTGTSSYLYPMELQSSAANVVRLQTSLYRRVAGADWNGTAYRMQYAVDNSFTDGSKAFIEVGASDPSAVGGGFLSFGTAGVDRLSINGAGNVGIGTTTPASLLHVQGTSTGRVLLGTLVDFPAFGGIGFQSTLTSANYSIAANINGSTLINTVNGTNIDFRVNNATKMLLSNLGLVGIGSSTPSSMLSITGNAGVTPLVTVASSTGASLFTILANGNVGIGATTPLQKLDIAGGNLRLDNTTFGSQTGVVYKNTERFIHNFNYGNNGTVTTLGANTFVGVNSGNFTMGSTAVSNFEGSYNTGLGFNSLVSNTTGYGNIGLGVNTLYSNSTGVQNTSAGLNSLFFNTSGSNNTTLGAYSLYYNTTGTQNVAVGVNTLTSNTTGNFNTALGVNALISNTTGSFNTALGQQAGYGSGSLPDTRSVVDSGMLFLGMYASRDASVASTTVLTNGIAIGYDAKVYASNQVVLGNSAITSTVLQGNVGIGTTTPLQKLSVIGAGYISGGWGVGVVASNNVSMLRVDGSTASSSATFINGNVGIGTTTPGSQLTVAGTTTLVGSATGPTALKVIGNIDNTAGGVNPIIVGGVAVGTNPYAVKVVGRYAYIANNGSNSFMVADVSNPAFPLVTSTTTTGQAPIALDVAGRYAYVVNYTAGTMQVLDVSNPSSVSVVGSVTVGTQPNSIVVSGNYAYVTNGGSSSLQVISIASPTAPTVVSTHTSGVSGPTSVAVSGRYAYVANQTSGTLQLVDISNPLSPVASGSISAGSYPRAVVVSGRYAYLADFTGSALRVIDISNPASPSVKATLSIGTLPTSVSINGRYAYVTNYTGNQIQVVDIASSTAPAIVGTSPSLSGPISLYVSGRYAYVASFGSSLLQVIDIGGLETSGATIASLEAGTAQIRNDLTVQGGVFTNALNAVSAYIENLSAKVLSLSSLALGAASNTVTNALLSLNVATTGTELVTKNSAAGFTVSGYATSTGVALNSANQGGGITLLLASTTSIGSGVMTAGPSLASGTLDDGGHAVLRPDGKYLVINGNGTAVTNIYDPVANTFAAGPSLSSGTVQHGGHSFQRPDGKFLLINANNTAVTNIYDPVANTFSTGPSFASGVANFGSHAILRPDGKYLVINASISATTNIYDPVANSFATGPSLATGSAYAGSHSIQRPDGKFLVINGNNTATTNIYDPIANTFVAGPTLASGTTYTGSHSIQRPDGKFLVINGNFTATTNIYDPVANTFVAGPSLSNVVNHGAYSIQRPDGKWLTVIAGTSSATEIYDPVTNTFSAGPTLASGTAFNGGFAIQRPDGKFLIVNGSVSATTNIYDPSYIMTGTWESEDMNMTDLNPSSVLNYSTNGEGKIEVAIKTATSTGALTASYTVYATTTSGSKILPVSGAQYAKVKVTFTRPVPTNRQPMVGAKEKNTWHGESEAKYQRTFTNPTLYSLNISNQKGYHVTNTDFGTNNASTTLTSNATSGPVISNLLTDGGLTLPYSLDMPDFSAFGDDKGVIVNATNTPANISTGAFSLQRPDGKFLLIVGNSSAATYIFDSMAGTYTTGPTLTNTVGSGAHAFQRPDGKFVIILGNSWNITNVYDPVTNTVAAGPNLTSNVAGGSNSLQRPDGKFLIYRGGTTGTDIYDPITNTISVGPTLGASIGMGSLSIPRPDGKFFVTPGGSAGPSYTYDPIANTFVSNGYSVTTDYGATAIQRPDGKWYILYGGTTATAIQYDPFSNTYVSAPGGAYTNSTYGNHTVQRPDGKFAVFGNSATWVYDPFASSGNTTVGPSTTGWYTGAHTIQRPDGKFITYIGNGGATSYLYDPGWVTRGTYDSEFINDATLDSNSVLTWKGNADAYKAGVVSVRVRTATSSDALQTASWRTLPVSGSRVNPGTSEVWMQVRFEMNRPVSSVTQAGSMKNVFQSDGANIVFNRLPLNPSASYTNQAQTFVKPTIYSYAIQKQEGQDLATFQVNGNNAFRFSATGDAYTSAGGSWNAGGADLAEYFPTEDGLLEPGDIVSVSKDSRGLVSMSTDSYDDTIIGIVTTAPGLRLGSDDIGANQGKQPIALAGRVPVKVSLENGVIKKGDYLTSSSRPGFAMKALDAGRVIGIALEDYTLEMDTANNGAGKVLVFVNPHFYMGASFTEKVTSQFSRFATMIQKGVGELGVTITSNGSVGIGVTNPLSRFQVAGDARLGVASTTSGRLIFQNEANDFTTTLQSATTTTSDLTFTLPDTLGNAREALMTDGTGTMFWGSVASIAKNASSTQGYVVRWLPEGEVASGVLMDDGIVAGVNATSTSSFTVAQATSTQPAFSILSAVKDTFFRVDESGLVSVGTSTAGSRFDIFDATEAPEADLFRIVSNVGGENGMKFKVSAAGDLFAKSSIQVGLGASLAESYSAIEVVDLGTVVAFGTTTTSWETRVGTSTENFDIAGVRKATTDREAIGVVTSNAGLSLATETLNGVPVAFVGRVPVKVTTENGEVKAGDYLTVSTTTPGSAMKLTGEGRALGRAVSNYIEGRDKVMMVIDNRDLMLDMAGMFATTTKMLTTGNVDLNANGVAIANIKSLASANGSWSIDEMGRIVGQVLCLNKTCVTEAQLINMMNITGQLGVQVEESPQATSTPEGEVAGAATSTDPGVEGSEPEETPVVETEEAEPVASGEELADPFVSDTLPVTPPDTVVFEAESSGFTTGTVE